MKKIFLTLLLLTFTLPIISYAQIIPDYTKLIDIVPPSPNSASLGKYGGINVGLVSGMANINIPLQGFTSHTLKLPISVSYSSNGLKVDEVASRVGMSWTLNSGGAITRTVMGNVDEKTTRIPVPSDFSAHTANLITFIQGLQNGAYDGQPDIFSFNFNGNTGQFVLDSVKNPVMLANSALKIEQNFAGTDWNFKVTTPDGVQYLFGGSGATETSNRSAIGGGRILPNPAATAWYLNKVIHPNRDTINLIYTGITYLYETGVNQTMYSSLISSSRPSSAANPPPNPQNTNSQLYLEVGSPVLSEINSTAGGKVKFFYSSRKDGIDQLLSRIEYYRPGQAALYKFFNLAYINTRTTAYNNLVVQADTSIRHRPFLSQIDEGNPSDAVLKTHKFSYNNLDQLPVRLSFAQDIYGYFNGKNNSTLIPPPTLDAWKPFFTGASADRSSDASYSIHGTLSKIQYPTGGSDSLIYEANTQYTIVPVAPQMLQQSLMGAGTGKIAPVTVKSPPFYVASQKSATMFSSCTLIPGTGYTIDPIHNVSDISVIDSVSGAIVFTKRLAIGDLYSIPNTGVSEIPLTAGHYYQLKITSGGSMTSGAMSITYLSDTQPPPQYANVPQAGLRISKVITNPSVGSHPMVKRYYYYYSTDPTKSSGDIVYAPVFEKFTHLYAPTQDASGNDLLTYSRFDYYTMFSNSLNNIYAYPAPIYYNSVIESRGDNFSGGGTEHHFDLYPDTYGNTVLGDIIPGVPLNSYSYKNGLEVYSCDFKMAGSAITPVKKVFTHFKEDPRVGHEFVSYVLNRKYNPYYTDPTNPLPDEFNAVDLSYYSHFRKWMYQDSVTTWNYDQTGLNYVTTLNTIFYDNPSHALVTRNSQTTSDGKVLTDKMTYPADTTLTGDEETGRLALISKYIIGTPIVKQQYLSGTRLNSQKVSFHVFPSGLVLPQTYNVQIANNAPEDRVKFGNYNTYGKLLNQSLTGGALTSYQWGYNNLYVVAECKNAPENDFFYESFEEGAGNTVSGNAKTGHYSHTGPYSKTVIGLDNGTYTLSYWLYSAGAWTLQTSSVTVSTGSYPISLSTQVDDIRLYPATAMMTTYTYDPLIGITSETNAKDEITFYEYDNFQRLMNVKDRDGNILKNYCYNYAGTISGCPVPASIATPASVSVSSFITPDLYDNEWKQAAPPGYTLATDNGTVITGTTTNAGRFAYFSTGGTITPLTPINGTLSFTAKGSGTIEIQLMSTYNDSMQYRKTFNLTSGYQNFTWALTNLYPQLEMRVGVIVNGVNTTPHASVQFLKNFSINLNQYGLTGDYTRFRADSTSVIGNSEKGWYGWSDHELAPEKKYLQHSAYGRMRFQTTARQVVIEYVRDFYDKRVINLFALTQTQNSSDWDATGHIIAGNNAINNYTKITAGQTYTISGLLTTKPTIVWFNGTTPMAAPDSMINHGTATAPLYQVTAPTGATNMGLLVQRTPADTYFAYSNCMVQLGAIGFKTPLDGIVPTPFTAFTGYTPSLISGPAIFINGSLYKYYQVEGNDVAKVIQFVSDTLPAGNKTVEVMMPGQGTYLPTDPHIRRSGTYLRSVYFPGTNTNVFPSTTVNPGSVVYIHDSILSGFNISSDAQNNVWMMKTQRDPTYGFTGDIFSEGYAGRILYTDVSTPTLTTQFASKLASFGVDKYWFQIGVNDYGFMTPLPAFYAQYKSLIEQLHVLRPNAKMYIQSTGPEIFEGPNGETTADDGLNSTGPAANDYRDIQRALGTSYSYCEYVNFEGLFPATIANTADGIHPTDAGNVLYANGIKNNSTLLGTVLPVKTLAFYRSSTRSFVYNKPGIYTFTATGGKAPYTFTKLSGTLPAGLTFNANGTITGTPTASGTVSISVKVTDANAATVTQSFSVPVNPAPSIVVAPVQLLDGVINTPYTFTNNTRRFRGYLGNGPYTLSISASTLPATMTFNPATGILSGTPTATGTYSFTITATDHYGFTGSTIYTWHVVSVTPTPLVDHFTPTAVLNGTSITVTGHLTDIYDTQLFTYIYAYVTQGGVEYGVAGSLVNVEAFKKDGTPVVFPGIDLSHGAVTNIRLQNGGINPSSLDGITILYNANTNITP